EWQQAQDRQGSRPSMRGVNTFAQAPSRQKISSFLDGLPISGQQGGVQFYGVDRVEIARGPQSTAYGRSTFAGAVNYVSRNPGEEFEAQLTLGTSDLERNKIHLALGGPLFDGDYFSTGYTIDAAKDKFKGPDHWFTSDGYRMGGLDTTYITTKLTFAANNDSVDGYIRHVYKEITDTVPVRWYITKDEQAACATKTLGSGMAVEKYLEGAFNCTSAIPTGGYSRNHNAGIGLTGTDKMWAETYSALDPGSNVKRQRVQGQVNFNFDNGSTISFLGYTSKDDLRRWYDSDDTGVAPVITTAMGMTMVAGVTAMANPGNVNDWFAEARWTSPDDQRLRWLVGASRYRNSSEAWVWSQYGGVYHQLESVINNGNDFVPNQILGDHVKATGIYGSINYDLTDRATLSVEVRQQRDDLTNRDVRRGFKQNLVTESFSPRVALNYDINDELTSYFQFSKGTNPAGTNVVFMEPTRISSLQTAKAAGAITWDETTFITFDEEQLTNMEVGLKGTTLGGRLNFSAAYYVMDWEKMIQPFSLNWSGDWDAAGNFQNNMKSARTFMNTGNSELSGFEFEGNAFITDNLSMRLGFSSAKAQYKTFCDPVAVTTYKQVGNGPASSPTACHVVDGNDIQNQPNSTWFLSPTYRAPLGDTGWRYSVRFDARYTGETYNDSFNMMMLPSTINYNGSLTFSNDNWRVQLWGRNLSDDETPRQIVFQNDNVIAISGANRRNFRWYNRAPREVGVTVDYNF
ncbi:MAG: hypothetical protein CBC38_03440, partial [Gammaproteobacteria bacterium TMED78]